MPGETARARPSDTMAKARKVLARHDTQCVTMTSTASVELIAREENVRPSTVWNWISVARGGPTAVGESHEVTETEVRPPPKPMSERVVAGRAWLTWHLDERFLRLEARAIIFWTQMVVAVHRLGDGFRLNFIDAGFDDRDDFATSCRGDAETLAMLIRRRLIDDLGDAIALPRGLGLTPRERVGGKLIPSMRSGRSAPDRRQGSLGPMAMPAPREPESELESNRSPNRSLPESGADDSGFAGFDSNRSPAGVAVAGGESTTTTTKDLESLFGSSGGGVDAAGVHEAAPDSGPTPVRTPVGTPVGTPVEDPAAGAPHVTLAAELLPLIGRAGTASPAELNLVRSWLETRTANDIRAAIGTRMERKDAPHAPDLSYFDQRIRQWGPRVAYQPPPAAPPAPEPPEDPAATIDLIHSHEPDNPVLVTAWTPMRATLKVGIGEAEYRSWVREMKLGGLDGDEIVMLLPNSFACDWVRDRYGPRINILWKAAYPEARRVDFRVRS